MAVLSPYRCISTWSFLCLYVVKGKEGEREEEVDGDKEEEGEGEKEENKDNLQLSHGHIFSRCLHILRGSKHTSLLSSKQIQY